jgi:hypothetical protein
VSWGLLFLSLLAEEVREERHSAELKIILIPMESDDDNAFQRIRREGNPVNPAPDASQGQAGSQLAQQDIIRGLAEQSALKNQPPPPPPVPTTEPVPPSQMTTIPKAPDGPNGPDDFHTMPETVIMRMRLIFFFCYTNLLFLLLYFPITV